MEIKEIINKIGEMRNLPKGMEFRETREILLKKQIIQLSDLENKGIVEVGDFVLTWHPRIKTRKWPNGLMMIYTKESWQRAQKYKEGISYMNKEL